MYNLELFGIKLKNLRISFGYTQKDVSELAYIDQKTLRRIENGENMPRLDTLDILSPIFRVDLFKILHTCKIDDYSYYYNFIKELDLLLVNFNFSELSIKIEELEEYIKSVKDDFYIIKLTQLLCFCKAIFYSENQEDYLSLKYYLNSIRKTKPSFCLVNYENFNYDFFEIRILYNIGKMLSSLDEQEKNISILEFCTVNTPENDVYYPRICNSLANIYNRMEIYNKAITYYDLGIKSAKTYSNLGELGVLYYGKGSVEFETKNNNYVNSFKSAIKFCDFIGRENLKNLIIEKMDEYYNIDYKTLFESN